MLEPFLLERRLLPKVWGGRALQDQLGISVPADGKPIGESWELFDRPDGSSRVRGSTATVAELVRRDPEKLVGRGVPLGHKGSFPLMLKFLDASQGLSLQVHPDDRQARGDLGKNE
ncbi:MAG: class I mannose-6-phosphate isomerase, partial [Planctomycetes bacterium]|nr:class I mannose-6-phosphate isomerase [Planctomycetota bacterium]